MKKSRPLLLSKPVVILGLTIAFSLAVGTAGLSVFSIREVSSSGGDVVRIQTTLLDINRLLTSLINAETGQRGYLLTGRDEYLAPYHEAIREIPERLRMAREHLSSAQEQIDAFNGVEQLVSEKLTEIRQTLALKHQDDTQAAIRLMVADTGRKTMDAIRIQLGKITGRELQILAMRAEIARQRTDRLQRISLAMVGIAIVMTVIGAMLFIRRVHELETMITVCAWTKRVKYRGKWVSFEDYLHSRFNLEFTHSISEDAAKKLMLDELELHPDLRGPVKVIDPVNPA